MLPCKAEPYCFLFLMTNITNAACVAFVAQKLRTKYNHAVCSPPIRTYSYAEETYMPSCLLQFKYNRTKRCYSRVYIYLCYSFSMASQPSRRRPNEYGGHGCLHHHHPKTMRFIIEPVANIHKRIVCVFIWCFVLNLNKDSSNGILRKHRTWSGPLYARRLWINELRTHLYLAIVSTRV